MLDGLFECIESLQSRIETYQQLIRRSEFRTRSTLIDPILGSLGWDVSDPALVTVEFEAGHGKADYALLNSDGKPIAIIEAKKLGASLTNHRLQMLTYANSEGIKYAALTDGDVWEMYDVFMQATLDERKILDVSIQNHSTYKCALKLLSLWNVNLGSGKPVKPNPTILRDFNRSTSSSQTVSEGSVSNGPWLPLSKYKLTKGVLAPTKIKFWDDVEVPVKSWRDFVFQTAKKLAEDGRLTHSLLPIGNNNRNFVHSQAIHADGTEMVRFWDFEIGNTRIFVHINVSAYQALQRVHACLERCGIRLEEVQVMTE